MRFYDISVTISPDIVTWENRETGLIQEWTARIDQGLDYNASTITVGSHCGTHVDAPLHFIDGGGTVVELAVEDMIGPCLVIEMEDLPERDIRAADLEAASIPRETTRLLLKTSSTRRRLLHDPGFHSDFVAIAPDAASWLVKRGIRTVGIDYLSVGSAVDKSGIDTHQVFLEANVVLLEGLLMDEVPPGHYQLVALPLKVAGAEACPVRAVLLADD